VQNNEINDAGRRIFSEGAAAPIGSKPKPTVRYNCVSYSLQMSAEGYDRDAATSMSGYVCYALKRWGNRPAFL
jgi:hypothetical protein